MPETCSSNSVEQRRKLLKGALAASGVVTMGYSGAALASFECVPKVRLDGGYAAGDLQFTMTNPSQAASSNGWAWLAVTVQLYQVGTNTAFPGFVVNGLVYPTAVPTTPPRAAVSSAVLASDQTGYPQTGWVLAYFKDDGDTAGATVTSSTYPTYTTADEGHTPATESCLASLNPGIRGNFTFGG